jgi:hypothetical protein
LTPSLFFSRSVLAAEKDEEPPESYERDSTEYKSFKELASWDKSFEILLRRKGIDPRDPVPKNVAQKDEFFRKIKPIALLRTHFLRDDRGRPRKAAVIYAGKEAVYAICEGNPRWLRGLLNDFVDLGTLETLADGITRRIRYSDQARVLNTAGQRFLALIKASPFKPPFAQSTKKGRELTLLDFVLSIGSFFQRQIYGTEFPLDPIGTFGVPHDTDDTTVAVLEQLLELGAVVYVGTSPQDVPVSVRGSRFRLSFILASSFKLPLRTYRDVTLDDVLMSKHDPSQLSLDF